MTATTLRRRSRAAGLFTSLAVICAAIVTASGPVFAASHDISIVDFGFEPTTQEVFVGEPVTWTNNSTTDHTVTSDLGAELDGNPIRAGEAYGHVFEQPGTYAYHCEIHPDDMTGTITVTAAAPTPIPSGTPEPTPPSGTLPPNFSPFPSAGPVESSPGPITTARASADPGAGGFAGGSGPQFLVLAFIGAALLGVIAVIVIRRRRDTKA